MILLKRKLFLYLMVLSFMTGCVSVSAHKAVQSDLASVLKKQEKTEAINKKLTLKINEMEESHVIEKKELMRRYDEKKDMLRKKEIDEQALHEMVVSFKSEAAEKTLMVNRMEKALKVEFLGKVFFNSGSAELTRDGKTVISEIASVLKNSGNHGIEVIGHADSLPPMKETKKLYFSNWELSAARAASVIRLLQWGYNISPERMSVKGVGHYRPLQTEKIGDNRSVNRVVEIFLKPIP